MKTALLYLLLIAFCIYMIIYTTKKKNKLKKEVDSDVHETTAYQLYSNWCKKYELTPVQEDEFNKLKNKNGSVNITDMIALHPEFQVKFSLRQKETDAKEKQKEEEQKKAGQQFGDSAVIGYLTDSTVAGTLLGGSLLGGTLGSHLSKKEKK